MTYDEWYKKGQELFGEDKWKWKFRCPACGHVQSIESLLENNPELDEDDAIHMVYFSCEGRVNGKGKPVFSADKKLKEKPNPIDGCNWSLGGTLQIHKVEVEWDNKNSPVFEYAD